MALQDTTEILIVSSTAAESLPDPTTRNGQAHWLVNASDNPAVYSAAAPALPYQENGVNVATITIPAAGHKSVRSNGAVWIVTDGATGGGLAFPTVTSPARALNAPFTPHATRPVLGLYTVSIGGTTTLLSGDDGRIRLRSDLGVPATIRASARNRVFQGLGVTVGTNSVVESELVFLIPPGWSVDLSTEVLVAAPVFTLVRSTEIVL